MSRRRLTWREAAFQNRRADIYQMNQVHPDPTPVQYESGDPSTWAEDVMPYDTWKQDYMPRNEIGEGAMRHETFDHRSVHMWDDTGHPYDNPTKSDMTPKAVGASVRASMANRMKLAKVLEAKAEKCIRIATEMLGEEANEKAVEAQAFALMGLNEEALDTTLENLKQAKHKEEKSDDGEEKSAAKSDEKSDEMKMGGMDEFKNSMKSDESDEKSMEKSGKKHHKDEEESSSKDDAKMARMARLRRMAAYGSKSEEESSKEDKKAAKSKEDEES